MLNKVSLCSIFLYKRITIFTMKDMKKLKELKQKLHVLHGDLSFFVVPEGHDRY
jgi:hypothetical protein